MYKLNDPLKNPLTIKTKTKIIFVFSVLVFNFVSRSAGLMCYECNDYIPEFECNQTTSFSKCHKKYEFCATYYYKNDEQLYFHCEDREYCIQKRCARPLNDHCKASGTFEGVDYDGEHFTVDCCKGDLCNRPSSSHYFNHKILVFTFLLNILYFNILV